MEQRDKKFISVFLLVVGAVFILIAGSIFVTTAWRYLPEGGKKLLLFGVSAGLLAVSGRLLRTARLEKAGTALFYLGVGFAGFFVVFVLGGFSWGMTEAGHQWAAWKLFVSHLVMLFLSFMFLVRRRKGFPLGISVILLDGCLIWGCQAFSLRYGQFLLMMAGLLLLFSAGDFLDTMWLVRQTREESRGLRNVFTALWILHVVLLCWMTLFEGIVGDFLAGEGMFFTFLLTVASIITFQKRKMIGFRVINSILLFLLVYISVRDLFSLCRLNEILGMLFQARVSSYLGKEMILSEWEMAFVAFIVSCGLTLWQRRREMKMLLVFTGEILAFSQPYIDIPDLFRGEWRCGLLAVGIVLFGHIWYDKWKEIRWVQFALICQQLVGLLLHDLYGGQLENILILGLTALVILLAASVYNRREYVIASSVLLLLIALYLTRSVWLSIAWWVYLLVAGVVLIAIAVRWEKNEDSPGR